LNRRLRAKKSKRRHEDGARQIKAARGTGRCFGLHDDLLANGQEQPARPERPGMTPLTLHFCDEVETAGARKISTPDV
jgi:hypothetical protein